MVAIKRLYRVVCIVLISALLSGCVYWRLYQTKMQIDEFDKYFIFNSNHQAAWFFKDPIILSDDFVYLSKLQPSACTKLPVGQKCQYRFRKANENKQLIFPEVQFYFELTFNEEDRLQNWLFSPLFLQIAPAKLIELSLRSLGGAKILTSKNQVKADVSTIQKVPLELPEKATILKYMGAPLKITREAEREILTYYFLLETPVIEKGYEDRALTVIRLFIDNNSQKLIEMSGKFAGLKLSIDYRKFAR